MNIQTKYHGTVKIKKEAIWHFEKGIPGFLEEKEFVSIEVENNNVFSILQSTTTPAVAFVLCNPFDFFNDYTFRIDDTTLTQLALGSEEDVAVYAIVNVQNPFDLSTANLLAPIILNTANYKAKQLVLNGTQYQSKHLLNNQTTKVKG